MRRMLITLFAIVLIGIGGLLTGCGEQAGEPQYGQQTPEQAPPVTDETAPQVQPPAAQEGGQEGQGQQTEGQQGGGS